MNGEEVVLVKVNDVGSAFVLSVADTYVPPTFYYQVVAMNSSPQICRVVVRGLTVFEER